MNREYDITLVEKYFDRELTPAEGAVFEARLKSDPAFSALVEQEKLLLKAVRLQGLQRDMTFLETLEKNLPAHQPASWHIKPWYYAAAAVVLIAAVTLWWLPGNDSSSEELFQAYFKPYPNVFEPTVRSTQSVTQRTEAFQAYEQGDYAKAATLFEQLLQAKKEPGILLLLGNSNLMTGRLEKAEENFSTLIQDYDDLDLQGKWYLSLCYLKKGDVGRARSLLKELGQTDVSYAAKAKELLQKVD